MIRTLLASLSLSGCVGPGSSAMVDLGPVQFPLGEHQTSRTAQVRWEYPHGQRPHRLQVALDEAHLTTIEEEISEFYKDFAVEISEGTWGIRYVLAENCTENRCVYEALLRANMNEILPLAMRVRDHALLAGHSRYELVGEIIAMVQSIHYEIPTELPFEVASPLDVLVHGRGDCDSKALLAYALLRHVGVDSEVIISRTGKHAMLVVDLVIPGGDHFEVRGRKYAVVETTARGMPLGVGGRLYRDNRDWRASEIRPSHLDGSHHSQLTAVTLGEAVGDTHTRTFSIPQEWPAVHHLDVGISAQKAWRSSRKLRGLATDTQFEPRGNGGFVWYRPKNCHDQQCVFQRAIDDSWEAIDLVADRLRAHATDAALDDWEIAEHIVSFAQSIPRKDSTKHPFMLTPPAVAALGEGGGPASKALVTWMLLKKFSYDTRLWVRYHQDYMDLVVGLRWLGPPDGSAYARGEAVATLKSYRGKEYMLALMHTPGRGFGDVDENYANAGTWHPLWFRELK